jgi:hypothetical protein
MSEKEEKNKRTYAKILNKRPEDLTDEELLIIKHGSKIPGWKPAPLGPGEYDPNRQLAILYGLKKRLETVG